VSALWSSFLVDISPTKPRQTENHHGAGTVIEQPSVAGSFMRSFQLSDEIDEDDLEEDDDDLDDEDETRDEDDNEDDDDEETETWQVD
jgi:hypothetical protein